MAVYVCLANGFEEIEALGTVDILRRAGLTVCTVGIGGTAVTGSHGMTVTADLSEEKALSGQPEAVVLPGGLPGATNLDASRTVQTLLERTAAQGGVLAAICAAPLVLGHKGLLQGKRATCYPGFESELHGATPVPQAAVTDGSVITGNGPGALFPFALALVEKLVSPEKAAQLKEAMQCR